MSGSSPRGRRRKASEVTGPLSALAARVKVLAENVRNEQTTSDYVAALLQRRDQLETLADTLESLAAAAAVLRGNKAKVPRVAGVTAALQSANDLRTRYSTDPQSVRQPQPRNLDSPVAVLRDTISKVWSAIAEPDSSAIALVELLGSFPPRFRPMQQALRALCDELDEAASRLPTSAADALAVSAKKAELERRLRELSDLGLDEDVQEFFRQSKDHVPLAEVLDKPALVEFLRSHPQLLASFVVTFRRGPTAQVKR